MKLRISIPMCIAFSLGMLAIGCSGDKSTDSHSGFPTVNLTDQLVVRVSDSITVSAAEFNDSAGLLIPIPDSLFADTGENPDIYLSHFHCTKCYCTPDRFEVLNSSDGSWAILDEPLGVKICVNDGTPNGLISYDRFLSAWEPHPVSVLLDTGNRMRVRGNFQRVEVRLVSRTPDYSPQLVAAGAIYADIAWSDNSLLVTYNATRREGRGARLEWLDESGCVIRSTLMPGEPFSPHRLLVDNDVMWTLGDSGLQLHSKSGDVVGTIEIQDSTPPFPPTLSFVFWKDGYLWAIHKLGSPPYYSGNELIGMDPVESLDSGYAIFGPTQPFPSIFSSATEILWDGEVYRVLKRPIRYWDGVRQPGHIFTVSEQGDPIDSIVVPVLADCFAWDGETYWIAHHGTPELPSTDILLSRFYPR